MQSILHTVKALFWALLLLGLIVYVFAILFSQAVYDYVSDPANPALPEEAQEAAVRYFGTLIRSLGTKMSPQRPQRVLGPFFLNRNDSI